MLRRNGLRKALGLLKMGCDKEGSKFTWHEEERTTAAKTISLPWDAAVNVAGIEKKTMPTKNICPISDQIV